jgi:GNAT superfamily N-acetyltransferase
MTPAQPTDLQPHQHDHAIKALVGAFWDDPMVEYIVPDERTRATGLPWFFGLAAKYAHRYGGTLHTTPGGVQGAALWLPPGETITDTLRMIRLGLFKAPFKMGLGGTMRFFTAFNHLEHLHKNDVPADHWYLWVLGVDPERQGQGVGGSLIAPIIERADRDRLPCYHETMKERNVTFYEKHGFEVVVDDTIKNGPRYWTMRREPIG